MMRQILIFRILFLGALACRLIAPGGVWAQQPAKAKPDNLQIVLKTTKGDVVVELFSKQSPKTIDTFIKYVRKGRYYKLRFERYADGYAIQLESPDKVRVSSDVDERGNGLSHVQGAVGLVWDYIGNKCGSKLYICLAAVPQLNKKHTVIGQVIEGMEILSQLRPGDILEKIKIRKSKRK